MQTGGLTIGDTNINYGGGSMWNTNTSDLLLACLNNTEIAVTMQCMTPRHGLHLLCIVKGLLINLPLVVTWDLEKLKV